VKRRSRDAPSSTGGSHLVNLQNLIAVVVDDLDGDLAG
jgi:hypothetical protein